jgi:cardiolipin synthase
MPWRTELLTAANLLTLARLALTPWIGVALARGDFKLAVGLLFVAGWTDAFDGWAARRWGQASRAGALLDPVADKALLVTVFISLGLGGAVPGWLVWLVLGRDAAILTAAGLAYLLTTIRDFPPSRWGKLSTLMQLLYCGGVILIRAFDAGGLAPLVLGLQWACAAATIGSGAAYGLTFARRAMQNGRSPVAPQ